MCIWHILVYSGVEYIGLILNENDTLGKCLGNNQ